MTATDARVSLLRAEILRDWQAIGEHLRHARETDAAGGAPQAAYIALSLDHAYQAFETILLRIERALDLPERRGEQWHRALLDDAALSLSGIRPPVYPSGAARDWEELLRFRHFLRHAYHVGLDPDRLAANVARLDRAISATDPFIQALLGALVLAE